MKKFIYLIIFVSFFCLTEFLHADDYDDKKIRIAIAQDIDNFIVSARGKFSIIDPNSGSVLMQDRRLKNSRVIYHQGKIHIGKNSFNSTRIRIASEKDVGVWIADKAFKSYRESIDIVVENDNQLTIINRINIEDYVKGVLYHEVSHRWPMEATKAQAVAARSYALYQMKANRKNLFDVRNDIYSQVYGGKSAERYRTNLAVDETEGEVLLYNREILPTYYHSNSGGHTEDASELWNHDLAPLKGVKDPYVENAPNHTWIRNFRSKDVQDKLNAKGNKIGLIKAIEISEYTSSGRAKKVRITARDGKSIEISGKEFRHLLGPNLIKSSLFDVVMKGYYFDVIGHGWGHGVGMSQWGAMNMAEKRFKYDEILSFYYPGSEIAKIK